MVDNRKLLTCLIILLHGIIIYKTLVDLKIPGPKILMSFVLNIQSILSEYFCCCIFSKSPSIVQKHQNKLHKVYFLQQRRNIFILLIYIFDGSYNFAEPLYNSADPERKVIAKN